MRFHSENRLRIYHRNYPKSRVIFSQFNIGDDSTRFGLFRFNRFVDKRNEILLNSHPNNKADLVQSISNLPYNGEGKNQIVTMN